LEIIAEILIQLFAWLLQSLGEVLVQIAVEIVVELMGHSLKEPFRRPEPLHPWLAVILYFILGGLAGGVSLWLFPQLFIKSPLLTKINLLLTPIISGLIMSWIGAWRRHREQQLIRLDTFAYGFCFALAMALVRFLGAA